jgi:hypothetical protein
LDETLSNPKDGGEPGRKKSRKEIETQCFFAKANQRKRKKIISCLEQDGVTFFENKDMIDHVMQFYKQLFREEPRTNIELDEGFWEGRGETESHP